MKLIRRTQRSPVNCEVKMSVVQCNLPRPLWMPSYYLLSLDIWSEVRTWICYTSMQMRNWFYLCLYLHIISSSKKLS